MASHSLYTQAELGDFSALAASAAARKGPAAVLEQIASRPRLVPITPASRLGVRPSPEMVSSGIPQIDSLTGGFPRGCLSEICGRASSGRTSILIAALAAATRRQEVCSLVDSSDAFNPFSAAAAEVDFARLLWVRCGAYEKRPRGAQKNPAMHAVEQTLRATDLLLQSGGFGMIVMDLADIPFTAARRIPLTTWFRFQRAVENKSTVLLVLAQSPLAATCASVLLQLKEEKLAAFKRASEKARASHVQILEELPVAAELVRTRLERKPVRSAAAEFVTRAVRIS